MGDAVIQEPGEQFRVVYPAVAFFESFSLSTLRCVPLNSASVITEPLRLKELLNFRFRVQRRLSVRSPYQDPENLLIILGGTDDNRLNQILVIPVHLTPPDLL